MSSGIVRATLSEVVENSLLKAVPGERSRRVVDQARLLLEAISNDEDSCDVFDAFSHKLLVELKALFESSQPSAATPHSQREGLWTRYHLFRTTKLLSLWQEFVSNLEVSQSDNLLAQYISENIFNELLKNHFDTGASEGSVPKSSTSLNAIEENVMRYACGYVPLALIRKLEKKSIPNRITYIKCLSKMAVTGDQTSFLDYTKQWITRINRGGLFVVSDDTYMFFKEVETIMRHYLNIHSLLKNDDNRKESIVKEICGDGNVLWYWTTLSTDLESEDDEKWLLSQLIELWLTIRGHSVAGAWLEHYKQSHATTKTKKSVGLRKGLKRKRLDMEQTD